MDEVERIAEHLKTGGAEVKPGSELPQGARDMIDGRAKGIPPGRVSVDLSKLHDPPEPYVYEDDLLKLTIGIPELSVFDAYIKEVQALTASDDYSEWTRKLARAFWLLHQRRLPWHRHWWVPKINDKKARELLAKVFPRPELISDSLPNALMGLITHVLGKKKVNEAADTAD